MPNGSTHVWLGSMGKYRERGNGRISKYMGKTFKGDISTPNNNIIFRVLMETGTRPVEQKVHYVPSMLYHNIGNLSYLAHFSNPTVKLKITYPEKIYYICLRNTFYTFFLIFRDEC